MGLFAYASGPHPGQMSDTTLARKYRPLLHGSDTLLADLAYLSVPYCHPQVKKPQGGDITFWQSEFNRIHPFYWARVELYFGHLHTWAVIRSQYRGTDLRALRQAVTVLCAIRNMTFARLPKRNTPTSRSVANLRSFQSQFNVSVCFNMPYAPYSAA